MFFRIFVVIFATVICYQALASSRIIVNMKNDDPETIQALIQQVRDETGIDVKLKRHLAKPNTILINVMNANPDDRDSVIESLNKDDAMLAEPDFKVYPTRIPTEPLYQNMWQYFEPAAGINAELAWDFTSGKDIVVAVIDTGILPHPDLIANTLPGYDMMSAVQFARDGDGRDNDPTDEGDYAAADFCEQGSNESLSTWHGTHVAGTIAAASNGEYSVGVAFDAKIVPIRALGSCGGFVSDIIDSIYWAIGELPSGVAFNDRNRNPAQIINMSLGGEGSCSAAAQAAVNAAREAGATLVTAAGNANAPAEDFFPGNCAGVLNVAALNDLGARASYSNFGDNVGIAAPGGDFSGFSNRRILSTHNSGQQQAAQHITGQLAGTSMAAPHVAGVAALLKSIRPALTPDQIIERLQSTARPFTGNCDGCGSGMLDASAAVLDLLDIIVNSSQQFVVEEQKTLIFESNFFIGEIQNGTFSDNNLSIRFSALPDRGELSINGLPANTLDNVPLSGITVTYTAPDESSIEDNIAWVFEKASRQLSNTQSIQVTVTESNEPPTITRSLNDQQATINTAFELDLNDFFSDQENDPINYSVSGLPEGLALNGSIINGTATQTGIFAIIVSARDSKNSTEQSFTITINNAQSSAGMLSYLCLLLLTLLGWRKHSINHPL